MSTTSNTVDPTTAAFSAPKQPDTIASALVDVGRAWLDVGLTHAKTSLASSARAMERTAKALEAVRGRIRA